MLRSIASELFNLVRFAALVALSAVVVTAIMAALQEPIIGVAFVAFFVGLYVYSWAQQRSQKS